MGRPGSPWEAPGARAQKLLGSRGGPGGAREIQGGLWGVHFGTLAGRKIIKNHLFYVYLRHGGVPGGLSERTQKIERWTRTVKGIQGVQNVASQGPKQGDHH